MKLTTMIKTAVAVVARRVAVFAAPVRAAYPITENLLAVS